MLLASCSFLSEGTLTGPIGKGKKKLLEVTRNTWLFWICSSTLTSEGERCGLGHAEQAKSIEGLSDLMGISISTSRSTPSHGKSWAPKGVLLPPNGMPLLNHRIF